MQIVTVNQSAHYYTQEGSPAYDADLRRARKENLGPSVTTAMSVLAKPGLEAWKQEQMILSALTLPRPDWEAAEEFARRVVEDSREQSKKAAEKGEALHAVAEEYMRTGQYTYPAEFKAVVGELRTWLDANVKKPVEIESTFFNKVYGYGGRIDLLADMKDGRLALIDFKSQGVKVKEKKGVATPCPVFYDEWPAQLAAYMQGFTGVGMSVVISTNPEAPIIAVKEWTPEELKSGWELFIACLKIWRIQKNFPYVEA